MGAESIWEGDKLRRASEAAMLERFLKNEVKALALQERNQAVVLALDSQYGEGKTWFLDRFRQQLDQSHPVAFVDAWVDDGNNEPLTSIMAALNHALEPCLKRQDAKNALVGLTKAALPIIGKAAVGAGGKLMSKYLGDSFAAEAKSTLQSANSAKDDDSVLGSAIDKGAEGVASVVDEFGKALLDQYLTRQRSREAFKNNLRKLAASIGDDGKHGLYPPIFIIVDELDRCRPDYAISLLEEVKHLFDVEGVVFVIALHGNQLIESIKAVYGAAFDAKAYLRRFFTRHYSLRRLSMRELFASHLAWVPLGTIQFSSPPIWDNGRMREADPAQLAGDLLSLWMATPREALAVADGLRLFIEAWEHKIPIELPLVIAMLLRLVRGEEVMASPPLQQDDSTVVFASPGDEYGRLPAKRHDPVGAFEIYALGVKIDLLTLVKRSYDKGLSGYLSDKMQREMAIRFNGSWRNDLPSPMSTWSEYRDRVEGVGRFMEDVAASATSGAPRP